MARLSKAERRSLRALRHSTEQHKFEEAQAADARFVAINESIKAALARSASSDARIPPLFGNFA